MTGSLSDKPRLHASERLYGRAKGRPLSPAQQHLMDTVYPKTAIDPAKPLACMRGFEEVWFEIGFGGAEHLIWQARKHPYICVMGAEPFLNGVAKAVLGVSQNTLENVRLYHGDARRVTEILPEACLDRLFVLHPDPWPKTRHHKRRIISDDFVAEAHRLLKPGGTFRFASDIISYVDWALVRIHNHGGFRWDATGRNDWRVRPDDWPSTRYLEKALREGRAGSFFEFVRV